MPKLIDYPRTSYAGAWELAEIVDDTGGKCAIDTAARKLNRKVSGSFKAIIGSAVKFGLMTSKRELLSTTTLFKRIKHAYDKKEELLFHREAFLTPPLFTQLCRKFRSRELPIQMLDVMLIREFGVEEINAQGVAKAFVDGCRMVGLLDERNMVADIDALASQQGPRRELASVPMNTSAFRSNTNLGNDSETVQAAKPGPEISATPHPADTIQRAQPQEKTPPGRQDAVANLFGLLDFQGPTAPPEPKNEDNPILAPVSPHSEQHSVPDNSRTNQAEIALPATAGSTQYQIQVQGPGINTTLSILEEEDITIAMALLEKIRRQLRS